MQLAPELERVEASKSASWLLRIKHTRVRLGIGLVAAIFVAWLFLAPVVDVGIVDTSKADASIGTCFVGVTTTAAGVITTAFSSPAYAWVTYLSFVAIGVGILISWLDCVNAYNHGAIRSVKCRPPAAYNSKRGGYEYYGGCSGPFPWG